MTFEIQIPDEWPPELGLAMAKIMRQSMKEGFPVVVPVRKDVSPKQLETVFGTIRTVVQEAGLAA